ncbi:Polyketide synthase enoylreductase [Penicillium concentricum]|uniref:alcohol dehydrogenase n=1 Tax=Penicillium concentricum TaxID=293559 RepID=A0A9W9V3W7_9EURO|nr:Polyketide synthase enoylreductase [Penicillium concentricum]KAJ5365291.1 Polyketide synthase enoylreductase [Penicillium concentricum]
MTTIKSKKVNGAHRVLEIPKMQWAQVFEKTASALIYTQIPVPSISSDEILVQIHYSGVCHTDLHVWKGDWPLESKKDLVGGHEGAGVAVARGDNVSRVSIGDRVGVQWMNDTCGSCEFCSDGDQPLCPSAKISGYTVNGTFQQYAVCKATNAVRIPNGISLDEAAPILCAGVTVYKALKESNLQPGQIVAVVGAGGGLGTLACQYAKALGYRVLAISEGSSKKAMLVKVIGVDYFVDYIASKQGLIPEVQELTGGGPHAAIVVASVESPIGQAIQYIRPKGTVVVVGLHKNAIIKADLFSTVVKQKTVKGSYVGSCIVTEEALAIYANDRFCIQYQVLFLEELPAVFEKMQQGKMQGRTVLQIPSPETMLNGSIE